MPSLTSLLLRGPLSAAKTTSKHAEAALRAGRSLVKLPRSKPRRVVTTRRAAAAGGIVAGAAGFFLRRGGGEAPPIAADRTSASALASPTPAVTNYDASGPPSNTATPIPVVDASAEPLAIDEQAEVEAAAAEAANIGGPEIDYASAEPDMTAGDAETAVFEGGGGESEGLEQADADLVDTVTTGTGPGAGVTPAEQRIEEIIEQAGDPRLGETPDPAKPPSEGPQMDEGR